MLRKEINKRFYLVGFESSWCGLGQLQFSLSFLCLVPKYTDINNILTE